MSKKPNLTDIPGLGKKTMEKLHEAGIKTVAKLSKEKPDKLSEKVDGISEEGAAEFIAAAQKLVPPKKKVKKKAKKKVKRKAKKKEPDVFKREAPADKRLMKIAREKKRRMPKFRHDQAHRWIRVKDSWRKVRGIDSKTREKRRGRIKMVSAGYRTPKAVRGLHPSGYVEVRVERPLDLKDLDPNVHAIRIGATVGLRKRQEILKKADAMTLRVLNPGVLEAIEEEDLFTDLEDLEDLEVD